MVEIPSQHRPQSITAWRWICKLLAGCLVVILAGNHGQAEEKTTPAPQHDPGKFIDTHVHFDDRHVGDLDVVDAWMKANDVQRCIIHPLAQVRAKNDLERKQQLANYAQYKGRIDRFCILTHEEVNSVDEAIKILTQEKMNGAIGFGEHYGVGLMFDDPKNLMLYEACAKVGLPVMFHIDQKRNMDEKGLPRLERVLKAFPNSVLIAHSTGWWNSLSDGTCDRLLKSYPNFYADISVIAKQGIITRDTDFARAFFIRNADKLLFGSDSGWWSLSKDPLGHKNKAPEFELINKLNLPDDVREKICRSNAMRIFWAAKNEKAETTDGGGDNKDVNK